MEREQLGSRLGFILLSAGCAIGLGNVWKFPYMVGNNGGGMFVLFFLLFLLILGAPVLCMEFSMGRASKKSPVKMYQEIEPKGSKWHVHGYMTLAGCYILMMFYTVVAGWMIRYFFSSATGGLSGLDSVGIENAFDDVLADPFTMILITSIVIVLGFLVCSLGVRNSLERVTKVMMTLLLILIVVLAIHSLTLDGASAGLEFYLKPDIDELMEHGVANVLVAAMSQAFFTLSIGMGSMAIFGSYIDDKRSLMGESITIGGLDTFIAIICGLIVFPACFTFGVDVGAGPKLVFVTLPNVFNSLPMGEFWGSIFFLFLSFAALSTVFAVFESLIACTMELTNWSRKRASVVNCVLLLILSMPCALGFNVLSGFQPFGDGTTVLDLEDFIVSYLLLPLGALLFTLFCTTRYGWGWKNFKDEANKGSGLKIHDWMRPYFTFILPIIILIVLVSGLITMFM